MSRAIISAAILAGALGCGRGQEPCRTDGECGGGTCTNGACVGVGAGPAGPSGPVTPPSQPSAIELLQHRAAARAGAGAVSVDLPAPVAAGDLVVVAVATAAETAADPPEPAAEGLTDTLGNTFQAAGPTQAGGFWRYLALYYASSRAGGAEAITFTPAHPGKLSIAVAVFSGAGAVGPDDVGGRTDQDTPPIASRPLTPTVAGDLLVGAVTHQLGGEVDPGAGFQLIDVAAAVETYATLALEYRVLPDAGAAAVTFGFGTGGNWGVAGALFRPR